MYCINEDSWLTFHISVRKAYNINYQSPNKNYKRNWNIEKSQHLRQEGFKKILNHVLNVMSLKLTAIECNNCHKTRFILKFYLEVYKLFLSHITIV